jgi:tetratricopeptide (TPR) repeat protein
MNQNPVSQRIDLMRAQWEKAIAVPGTQVIRWFIKPDEWRMTDAFFEIESSAHGELPDIFFRMESPFENEKVYNKHLHEDWLERFNSDKETFALLEASGVGINYIPGTDHTLSFFAELQKLATAISTPELERNIIVYLSPSSVNEVKVYVQWIEQAIKNSLPPQVKIMLVDDEEHKRYTRLSDNYPRQVKSIMPDLGMSKVMRQMATSGNPAAPDVQFRKCVFEMADAVAKKDADLVESLGKKAVDIATKAGWKHLVATAYMITAGYLLSLKKYKRSESLYNEAINVSRSAYTDGDVACGILLIQCYSLQGASMQLQGEKSMAMQSYIQMAKQAEEMNDPLNAMEGWRLAAFAAEKSGKPKDSFDYYIHALEKGKQLDEKVRSYSGFLLVGEGAIEMAQLSGNNHRVPEIKEQMVTLVGPEWEKQLEKMKQTA